MMDRRSFARVGVAAFLGVEISPQFVSARASVFEIEYGFLERATTLASTVRSYVRGTDWESQFTTFLSHVDNAILSGLRQEEKATVEALQSAEKEMGSLTDALNRVGQYRGVPDFFKYVTETVTHLVKEAASVRVRVNGDKVACITNALVARSTCLGSKHAKALVGCLMASLYAAETVVGVIVVYVGCLLTTDPELDSAVKDCVSQLYNDLNKCGPLGELVQITKRA